MIRREDLSRIDDAPGGTERVNDSRLFGVICKEMLDSLQIDPFSITKE